MGLTRKIKWSYTLIEQSPIISSLLGLTVLLEYIETILPDLCLNYKGINPLVITLFIFETSNILI